MVNVIQVCGTKKTGKTTVASLLVYYLSDLGYKVGALKHDGHDFEPDKEGTDTYRFAHSGAKKTIIYSNERYMVIEEKKKELEELLEEFNDYDFLIVEGCKSSTLPKIEVLRKGKNEKPVCNPTNLLAYVTDFPYEADLPVLDYNDPNSVIEWVNHYLESK